MPNASVILDSASVQVIDSATSTYRVNSPIGNITLSATSAVYESYTLVPASPGGALAMPASTMWVVYVKNLDPTAIITVQVQPAGGALPSAVNSPKLPPGAVYIYWSPLETSGGIVGVTLISSVGNTPVEVLLAA